MSSFPVCFPSPSAGKTLHSRFKWSSISHPCPFDMHIPVLARTGQWRHRPAGGHQLFSCLISIVFFMTISCSGTLAADGNRDENKGDHVMKQLTGSKDFGLDECVVAIFLICIVLIGMVMNICVSMADFMRSCKLRATGRADDGGWAMIPQQEPLPTRASRD